jgi:hypothetical protein
MFHGSADKMSKERRQLLVNLLGEYLHFLRRKLSRLHIASQVIDSLGGELIKATKTRPALTHLEEVFTENYRNVQRNRQRRGLTITPGTRFSERRVLEDSLTKQTAHHTEMMRSNLKMIIFSIIWPEPRLLEVDSEKSLEISGVLNTNNSLRVSPILRSKQSSQVSQESNNKSRLGNSFRIDTSCRFNPYEREIADLVKERLVDTSEEALLTLGFDNFGQLGFPREMWTN